MGIPLRFPYNLPLQLCDITVWATVTACLTLAPHVIEFDYFAGIAGAGMALLTPDLRTPWPSHPVVYFFLAHGGIVLGISMLVFGRVAILRPGAPWQAYTRTKRGNASLLDAFGPWHWCLVATAFVALVFGLLWLPVRRLAIATVREPSGD